MSASRPRGLSDVYGDFRDSWDLSSQSSAEQQDGEESPLAEESAAELPPDVMPPPSSPPPPPPTREDLVRECIALRDTAVGIEDEGRVLQSARSDVVRQDVLEQRDAVRALRSQLLAAQSSASSEERERELRYSVQARRREVQHQWQQVLALRACAAVAVAGEGSRGSGQSTASELQGARQRLAPLRQDCDRRVALLRRATDGALTASRRGSTSLDRGGSAIDPVEVRKRLKVARHQRDRARQLLCDTQAASQAQPFASAPVGAPDSADADAPALPPPTLLYSGTFAVVMRALRGGEEGIDDKGDAGTGRERVSELRRKVETLQSRAEALRARLAATETRAQDVERTRKALVSQFAGLRASLDGSGEGHEAERARLQEEVEALEASAREFEGLDARGAARCVAQRVKGVRQAAQARSQARLEEARRVLQRKLEDRERELYGAFREKQEALVAKLETCWRDRVAQAQGEVTAVVRGWLVPPPSHPTAPHLSRCACDAPARSGSKWPGWRSSGASYRNGAVR